MFEYDQKKKEIRFGHINILQIDTFFSFHNNSITLGRRSLSLMTYCVFSHINMIKLSKLNVRIYIYMLHENSMTNFLIDEFIFIFAIKSLGV